MDSIIDLSRFLLFLKFIGFVLLDLLLLFNQFWKLVYLLRLSRWNLRLPLVALYTLLIIDILFLFLEALLNIHEFIMAEVLVLHVPPQIYNQVDRLLDCYVDIPHSELEGQELKKSHLVCDLKLMNEIHQKMGLVLDCFLFQKALRPMPSFLLVRVEHLFLRKNSDELLKFSNRRRNNRKGKRFHLGPADFLDEGTVHRHDVIRNRLHRIPLFREDLCDN